MAFQDILHLLLGLLLEVHLLLRTSSVMHHSSYDIIVPMLIPRVQDERQKANLYVQTEADAVLHRYRLMNTTRFPAMALLSCVQGLWSSCSSSPLSSLRATFSLGRSLVTSRGLAATDSKL